jgi:hypothetical protein
MARPQAAPPAGERPRIKLGSRQGIYHMSSKSKPVVFHVVDAARGTCSCDAGHHGRSCYHVRYCQQYDAALGRSRAQAVQQSTRQASLPALVINPPVAPGQGMSALLECFV